MQFDHIGIVTTEKKPGEIFVAATRVWITDQEKHPYHVEWLRFEHDSPVTGPLRIGPHIATASTASKRFPRQERG